MRIEPHLLDPETVKLHALMAAALAAACAGALHAQEVPLRDGRPTAAWAILPIGFSLEP